MAIGTIAAITGLAGGALGLWGASKQASAAKSAAQIQADAAAAQAAKLGAAGEEEAAGLKAVIPGLTDAVTGAATGANDLLTQAYQNYVTGVSPYTQAGTQALTDLTGLTGAGGGLSEEFTQKFDASKVTMDPAFELRLREGQKAIERSASAAGGFTGGTTRAIIDYGQEQPSKEYSNAYQRAQQEYQNALDAYKTNMATRFSRANVLTGLVSGGQQAATGLGEAGLNTAARQGTNLTGAAGTNADITLRGLTSAGDLRLRGLGSAADLYTDAARATAAGKVGSANAWAGGLSSFGQSLAGMAGQLGSNRRRRAPSNDVVYV